MIGEAVPNKVGEVVSLGFLVGEGRPVSVGRKGDDVMVAVRDTLDTELAVSGAVPEGVA